MLGFTMIAETIPALAALDTDQKLLLVAELWDSLTSGDEHLDIPVSEALLAELDARLEEFRRDPSRATTWEEAEARIRASRP